MFFLIVNIRDQNLNSHIYFVNFLNQVSMHLLLLVQLKSLLHSL